MDHVPDLLELSRELESLAQSGLTFSKDPYDLERYARLRAMASELLQVAPGPADFRWPDNLGYTTPKVDVRGAVFRDNEVLLIREAQTGLWTLPGGWADVNLSPKENVEKECLEESGYRVVATTITSLVDRERAGYPRNAYSIYKIYFLCTLIGGEATTSHESSGVDFFPLAALPPLDLHRCNADEILRAHVFYRRNAQAAHFN